jgi:hypothetical protein
MTVKAILSAKGGDVTTTGQAAALDLDKLQLERGSVQRGVW